MSPTSLKLGYVTAPAHAYGLALREYKTRVEANSTAELTIDLVSVPALGDTGLLAAVRGGDDYAMGSVSCAVWGAHGVRSFDALQAPFLITNYHLERKVITGRMAKEMLEGTQKLGLVGLAIHEGGLRKPFGRVRLTGPGTWKGKKIRIPRSRVLEEGVRCLDAVPKQLEIGEVKDALAQGTIDGMEANLGLIYTLQLYKVAKYVTGNVTLWPFPSVLTINKGTYDSLDPGQRQALGDAASGLAAVSLELFTNPAPDALDYTKLLCDEGVKFVTASDTRVANLLSVSRSAYARLNADPETRRYITRIRRLSRIAHVTGVAAPLPAGCADTQRGGPDA